MPSISIIVPAHNEEALLGGTLRALGRAAANLGEDCEIVVVDDGSTDRTAEIAATLGARVVRVDVRHIAAARNAGARAAIGDVFVFVDADTLVPPADGLTATATHSAAEGSLIRSKKTSTNTTFRLKFSGHPGHACSHGEKSTNRWADSTLISSRIWKRSTYAGG